VDLNHLTPRQLQCLRLMLRLWPERWYQTKAGLVTCLMLTLTLELQVLAVLLTVLFLLAR
jgi:hypothetical protein